MLTMKSPGPFNIRRLRPDLTVRLLSVVCLGLLAACARPAEASEPAGGERPLLTLEDLTYVGAFRLPAGEFGTSSLNYSEGPFTYDPDNHSIFIVGHRHHQNIAEFKLPALVNSRTLSDLNMAAAPVQAFTSVLDRGGATPQAIDRIGGLALINGTGGRELWVNAYEYYDAPGDNTLSTFVLDTPGDLAAARAEAFFGFAGGAGHTSGWLSPVPNDWQAELGGSHLTGQSSGIPIISRTSVGPSAFVFDPATRISGEDTLATTPLLDFSLEHPLAADLANETGKNKLWTHLSRVTYGFIVPGTRSYLTVGHSGGHESGVCYKCTQNDGNLCGGYCAPDANDYYLYYWLWNMNDLLAVKKGEKASYDVRPYAYGELPSPFPAATGVGGGAFDTDTGHLYLTLQAADVEQGAYSNPPVVVAYEIALAN